MPYTSAGIYYADTDTALSVRDIMHSFAESVDERVNILQTKSDKESNIVTTSSYSTDTPTGLSITITPKSLNSKIIISAVVPFRMTSWSTNPYFGAQYNFACTFNLLRDGFNIYGNGVNALYGYATDSSNVYMYDTFRLNIIDTPNNLSPVTYSIVGKKNQFSTVTYLDMNISGQSAATSTLTVMEVK